MVGMARVMLSARQVERLLEMTERCYEPLLRADRVRGGAHYHALDRLSRQTIELSQTLNGMLADREVDDARGEVMLRLVHLSGWCSPAQLALLTYVEGRCRLPFDEQRTPREARLLLETLRAVAPLDGDENEVMI